LIGSFNVSQSVSIFRKPVNIGTTEANFFNAVNDAGHNAL